MAVRTEDRKFGTYALDSTNGIVLSSWNDRGFHKARFVGRLKGDGSIPISDRWESREVSLNGKLFGEDSGATRDRLDALTVALVNGEDYLSLYDDRRLLCRLSGDIRHSIVKNTGGKVVSWSARMKSRIPYWEGFSTISDFRTPSGAGPNSLVLTNTGGSAPALPTILIENVGANFSNKNIRITSAATLKQLQLNGLSLATGESILIDMREGRIGNGLTSDLILPWSIDGSFFELAAATAATLELHHNVGAGASWEVTVSWEPLFWAL